jgi:3-hydroxyisobutyrate dehydrogenase-like beta-hydroxyacid dehydrogenase
LPTPKDDENMATQDKSRIGFIGVGLMGHGMAKNIVEKGFPLTIMGNRNRAPVEALVAKGAVEVKTPAEVARASDIVFLCVTDSGVVERLVRGAEGLKAGGHAGLVIVDTSTANPVSTQELAAELAPQGITICDAPLNGTPAQAELGQLGAMIGADEATLAKIRPAVEAWAGRIAHVGPVGAGHQMKLINNFIAMGYGAIYAEALALGRKVGISPQTIDSVIRGSRMDCGFYQTFFKYVLERDRDAHKFTLDNALKDLRYVEAMADAARMANPVGNAVKNSYAIAVAQGRGQDYVPMVSDAIGELNGVKIA